MSEIHEEAKKNVTARVALIVEVANMLRDAAPSEPVLALAQALVESAEWCATDDVKAGRLVKGTRFKVQRECIYCGLAQQDHDLHDCDMHPEHTFVEMARVITEDAPKTRPVDF